MKTRLALLTALIGLAGSVFAAEVVLRVASWLDPEFNRLVLQDADVDLTGGRYLYDELLGWKNIPGSRFATFGRPGRINSLGLRSPEYPYRKEPDRERILVLGDSFAWGYSVRDEEIFTSVLERALRSRGKRVEVINAGVSGWGTDQEYLYLEREGIRYDPDLVVVALFLNNDPTNNTSSNQYGLEKPFFRVTGERLELDNVPVPYSHRPLGTIDPSGLVRSIALLKFAVVRCWQSPDALQLLDRLGLISIREGTLESGRGERTLEVFRRTVFLIREMRDLCRQSGCEVVVMKFGRFLVGSLALDEIPESDARADRLFRRSVRRHAPGVTYFDLDDEFLRLGVTPDDVLKGSYDGHWNATGHRLAGEALASFLLEPTRDRPRRGTDEPPRHRRRPDREPRPDRPGEPSSRTEYPLQ